ncbi:hypothetical protein DPMN_001286 [Dreissena polymorpha]|uniref:HTH psq-type domain-containing protein n=1 Tax=Dreissena polymorpha TaxID=45954 RepID=A0A9D4MJS6_DREPO|nr:hypothetical protein DPMN_001286 [Dreissena polymorpha]
MQTLESPVCSQARTFECKLSSNTFQQFVVPYKQLKSVLPKTNCGRVLLDSLQKVIECDTILSVCVYKPVRLCHSKSYLNMMSNKRKRKDLSLADKYEVIKLLDQKMPQAQIARKMVCSQGQVSRISSNQANIMEEYESNANPEQKRHRSGKAADVSSAHNLVHKCQVKRHPSVSKKKPVTWQRRWTSLNSSHLAGGNLDGKSEITSSSKNYMARKKMWIYQKLTTTSNMFFQTS